MLRQPPQPSEAIYASQAYALLSENRFDWEPQPMLANMLLDLPLWIRRHGVQRTQAVIALWSDAAQPSQRRDAARRLRVVVEATDLELIWALPVNDKPTWQLVAARTQRLILVADALSESTKLITAPANGRNP